jgi:hypothetical protein
MSTNRFIPYNVKHSLILIKLSHLHPTYHGKQGEQKEFLNDAVIPSVSGYRSEVVFLQIF